MKTIVNISIDDVCPHPIMGLDAVYRVADLISLYPNLKCSIFMPTRLCRYKYKEKKYPIEDYPDFIEKIKQLPPNNFEICYHGHLHGYEKTKSNNDEFRYINEEESFLKLTESETIFEQVELKTSKVFRPPGFWMSKDAFAGCKKFGIKTLALNNKQNYLKCYNGANACYSNVIYIGKQPDDLKFIELLFHAGKDQKDFLNKIMLKQLKNKLKKWSPDFTFLGAL